MDFNLHIPANAAWFAVCAAIGSQNCPGSCGVSGQAKALQTTIRSEGKTLVDH
jgi:hypothetical protein